MRSPVVGIDEPLTHSPTGSPCRHLLDAIDYIERISIYVFGETSVYEETPSPGVFSNLSPLTTGHDLHQTIQDNVYDVALDTGPKGANKLDLGPSTESSPMNTHYNLPSPFMIDKLVRSYNPFAVSGDMIPAFDLASIVATAPVILATAPYTPHSTASFDAPGDMIPAFDLAATTAPVALATVQYPPPSANPYGHHWLGRSIAAAYDKPLTKNYSLTESTKEEIPTRNQLTALQILRETSAPRSISQIVKPPLKRQSPLFRQYSGNDGQFTRTFSIKGGKVPICYDLVDVLYMRGFIFAGGHHEVYFTCEFLILLLCHSMERYNPL